MKGDERGEMIGDICENCDYVSHNSWEEPCISCTRIPNTKGFNHSERKP